MVLLGLAADVSQNAAVGVQDPVSYTHLDVYKRQHLHGAGLGIIQAGDQLNKAGFCAASAADDT